MKQILLACLTLTLTGAVYSRAPIRQAARPKCNLTEANSPNVRGIRLGMSTDQLLALFPGSAESKEIKAALEHAKMHGANETLYLSFAPADYSTKDRFASIDSVAVVLYKGRAIDFTVVYLGTTWSNIDQWVAKLSGSFKLPGSREWTPGPSEMPNKVLKCNGFEIEAATAGGSASIRVRSEAQTKEMEKRAEAEEERRRHEFKPR